MTDKPTTWEERARMLDRLELAGDPPQADRLMQLIREAKDGELRAMDQKRVLIYIEEAAMGAYNGNLAQAPHIIGVIRTLRNRIQELEEAAILADREITEGYAPIDTAPTFHQSE